LSPTVRHERELDVTRLDVTRLDVTRHVVTPGKIRGYAFGLLALAVGVVGLLAAEGAAFPAAGEFLLLAIPLAWCMNRFVFFPNEVGVTADAAVIFAAVVAFRSDAVWLGPLLAALLIGPLDTKHWEERAFVRMAYNSGSTAIVTLAGVAAFVGVTDTLGNSWSALVGAAAVAAIPYVLVESLLGVVLVVLHGEPARAAIDHQLPVNTIAIPLACYGATSGWLTGQVGWWLAPLMLLPIAFVPELVLVSLRRRWTRFDVLGVLSMIAVASGTIALAFTLPFPDPARLAVLLACAVLLGFELKVDARARVPGFMAVVVVAALVVNGTKAGPLAAVLIAVAGTAAAWMTSAPRHYAAMAPAIVGASVAAIAGAGVYALLGGTSRSLGRDLAAAFLFEAVVISFGWRRRFEYGALAVWSAPLVAVSAALALLWRTAGWTFASGFALGLGAVLVGVAWSAAPPWPSRRLGRWAGTVPGNRRVAIVVAATASLGAAIAAVAAEHPDLRAVAVWTAVALGETAAAMALAVVRQWRFAPRRRARECAVLLSAAVAIALVYPPLGLDGSATSLGLLAPALALISTLAWPLAGRGLRQGDSDLESATTV
jgi:hypothetical protein